MDLFCQVMTLNSPKNTASQTSPLIRKKAKAPQPSLLTQVTILFVFTSWPAFSSIILIILPSLQ